MVSQAHGKAIALDQSQKKYQKKPVITKQRQKRQTNLSDTNLAENKNPKHQGIKKKELLRKYNIKATKRIKKYLAAKFCIFPTF